MPRYLVIFLGVGLFFSVMHTGCIGGDQKQLDTLSYEMKKLSLSFNQCNPDSPDCAHISYNYPVFNNQTSAADSLNAIINLLLGVSGKNTLAKTQETFLSEYALFVKQNPENNQVWLSKTNIDVPFQSSSIVCIGVNMYDFTGGAHGLYSQIYSCYDRKKNRIITIKDLFTQANYQKLLAVAEKNFRAQKSLNDTADLENAGFWFKDNTFHLNDNFVITNNGVDWLFNPYEVASYADGMIVISLDKSELQPLLNPDFLSIWD